MNDDPREDGELGPHGYHMDPETFRRRGYEVVDWIARYLERLEEFPVRSRAAPGEIAAQLPDAAPAKGEPFEQVLHDLETIVLPGITHWQSPNFFAFFPANASGPAILGEALSAGLGVQGMLWQTSPAATELETKVLDWLVPALGLPAKFLSTTAGGGVIQDTASSAALCALVAARERATGQASNRRGVREALRVYASTQTHSSLEKAVKLIGIGAENLVGVATDGTHALDPAALEQAVARDREAGAQPFFVCGTVGTTGSNAMDPLRAIGELARREGLWFHVDAAMSGTAALCPELRGMHDGLELADSYCFNPHKWMFTNFDCDCFWVADRRALVDALSILPEYLRNAATASGEVFDYRDWHVPLGRRFRALKLWMVLRHYGLEGLRHHVREHVALAREFANWVRESPRLELAVDPPLNLVCFRHVDGDEASERLLCELNDSGALYLTHTRLDQRFTLRMSIGGTWTRRRHVEAAWQRIQAAC
jgi:aromatic-L-amino-acid decarboxylase